eukprot:3604577-Rhodomonas_salina.8
MAYVGVWCYAEIAYAGVRWHAMSVYAGVWCYAMSGTAMAYAMQHSGREAEHGNNAPPRGRDPVLPGHGHHH